MADTGEGGAYLPQGPALLCVGHPGHELRVYGWLVAARPLVCVITDGSGRSGCSRIAATAEVLGETGGKPGPFFGAMTDREAYAAILEGNAARFTELADALAKVLLEAGVRSVAGDAAEGYNPTHDVCRLVINAAVAMARRRGAHVLSFDFPLTGPPDACDPARRGLGLELRLDHETLRRKLAAARRCPDLGVDVEEALRTAGPEAFRRELLRPAAEGGPTDGLPDEVPFYERHGASRVAGGKYARVLRRRAHVLPLAAAIWEHAERACL